MESITKTGTSQFQVAVVCFGLAIVLAIFIVYNVYKKPKRPDEMDSFVGGANNAGSGGSSITGPAPMAGATPMNPNLFDKGVPYKTGTNAGSNTSSNLPTGVAVGTASEPLTPSTEGFENPSDPTQIWAKANPKGAPDLAGKNFLNAGALIGVNTVGQSLRNGSWDVRSEPANPQVAISPWFNSTIEPDVNRRTLDGR